MINKVKILKYGDLIENVLNNQTQISSVERERSKGNSITFVCDVDSEQGYTRKMFVIANFLEQQDKVDVAYKTIIDNGQKLSDGAGLALASELTGKYRFIRSYIKESVSYNNQKEYFFVGEYDCLFLLDNLEAFSTIFSDISMMHCSTLADCIDIERNVFAEYDKQKNETSECQANTEEKIKYNPNPFE